MDRSERIGLGVSASGHVVVIGLLSLGLLHGFAPKPLAPPSIDVMLTDNVALESRVTRSAPPQVAQAPEEGATLPDAAPPPPPTEAAPTPAPSEQPAPSPQPTPKATPPKLEKTAAKPHKEPPTKAEAKHEEAKAKPARASLLGPNFLKGLDTGTPQKKASTTGAGEAPISPLAARALNAQITRQIKPFWKAPSGADADNLVTIVAVSLAPDGSIVGQPHVISQSGVTPSNGVLKQIHAENAIRAVRLAAPFQLPGNLYDAWKSLEIRFDKRLSQ